MQPVTMANGLADVALKPTLRLDCPQCGVTREYENCDHGTVHCAECNARVSKRLLVDTNA